MGRRLWCRGQFKLDPFTNMLFLFCDRRRNRIKGFYKRGTAVDAAAVPLADGGAEGGAAKGPPPGDDLHLHII